MESGVEEVMECWIQKHEWMSKSGRWVGQMGTGDRAKHRQVVILEWCIYFYHLHLLKTTLLLEKFPLKRREKMFERIDYPLRSYLNIGKRNVKLSRKKPRVLRSVTMQLSNRCLISVPTTNAHRKDLGGSFSYFDWSGCLVGCQCPWRQPTLSHRSWEGDGIVAGRGEQAACKGRDEQSI